MNSAVLLQHDEAFGPGRLVPLFRDYGIPVEVRKLHKGDEPPRNIDDVRLLVLLGGNHRVNEVVGKLPYIDPEIALAKQFIQRDKPILGIGFGCELLAHAGGGKVTLLTKPTPPPKPEDPPPQPPVATPELGWHNVTFPFPGGTEPVVFGMVDNTPMFHWHFDQFSMPALPPPATPPPPPMRPPTGNVSMASSRLNRTQAFRFKNSVFGFHFHFEFDQATLDAIVSRHAALIDSTLGAGSSQTVRADTTKHTQRYERSGEKLIRNLVQFMKAY